MKNKILLLIICVFMPFMINAEEEIANDNAIYGIQNTTLINESKSEFKADLRVNEDKEVDGIFFVAGKDVTVNGKSEYGFFAGQNIIINDTIEKDLFLAGQNITLNTTVLRDSYIAGQNVYISGNLYGNVYLAGSSITLENVIINGNLNIYCETLNIKDNVVIQNIKYNDTCNIIDLDKATINKIETYKDNNNKEESTTSKALDKLKSTISSILSFIVIAFLINYLFPNIYKNIKEKFEIKGMFKYAFEGLCILIGVPIVCFIAMFISFTAPASIIILVLYIILCCISKLIVMSYFGNMICEKLFKKKGKTYASISIGVVVYELIVLIPYLGVLIGFISLLIGLDYSRKLIFKDK